MVTCIATDSYPPALGGIATFYKNLADLLCKKGNRTIILSVDFDAHCNDEDSITVEGLLTRIVLRRTFIEKYNFYKKFFRPNGLDAPYWLATGSSMKEWLLQNHNQYQIDIIDVIDYGGLGVFFIDKQFPAVVITGHGSLTQYSKVNHVKNDDHFKVILELEKRSFMAADRILSYSPLNKTDLENIVQRPIHFATAPWNFERLNSCKTSSLGPPLVVAGLQKIKGGELLVKSLRAVCQEKPGFQCEWVGEDFYTAPESKSMSSFLEKNFPDIWNQHLLWKGGRGRESTMDKIANSKFIIIPSLFETFNYVSLEAATVGKAILMTETTGASYLFKHDFSAWIVPPDPEKLAEAILHLSSDTELCDRLGENAKKMIKEAFDENFIYEERMANYREALRIRKEKVLSEEHINGYIKNYTTPFRKIYYRSRALLKRIIKNH